MFEIQLFICIKLALALNNLQWLMCHKTKSNQTKSGLLTRKINKISLVTFSTLSLCLDKIFFVPPPGIHNRWLCTCYDTLTSEAAPRSLSVSAELNLLLGA